MQRQSWAPLVLCWCLCCLASCAGATENACTGPIVELAIWQDGAAYKLAHVHVGSLASFGPDLHGINSSTTVPFLYVGLACGPVLAPPGVLALVERGNCSFIDKALNVQRAGGVGMVLYNDEPGCVSMDAPSANQSSPTPHVTIPCISVSHLSGTALLALMGDSTTPLLKASLSTLQLPPVDAGATLLLALAVATTLAGAWWAGDDHMQGKRGQVAAVGAVEVASVKAAGLVVVAGTLLGLLLLFQSQAAFWATLALFCLASTHALAVWMSAVLGQCCCGARQREATLHLPGLGPCPVLRLLCWPLAAALCATWALQRDQWPEGAWALQALMGVALTLLVLRSLRVTLRAACVLLPAALIFEVIWVFYAPSLSLSSSAAQQQVAEVEVAPSEPLPLVFKVPRLEYPELGGCSTLGYADVWVPGVLLAWARRVDLDLGHSLLAQSYFLPSVCGYVVGLTTTLMAALYSWLGEQGQPALLYVVPCTLGAVLLLGALRRQLATLFAHRQSGRSGGGGSGLGDEARGVLLGPGSKEDSGVRDVEPGGDAGGGRGRRAGRQAGLWG